MQSFDLEMLFYAFLTLHFFLKMKCRCSESFFFSGRIRVNTPRMLSKWEYKIQNERSVFPQYLPRNAESCSLTIKPALDLFVSQQQKYL